MPPNVNTTSLSTESPSRLSTTMQTSDLDLNLLPGSLSAELPARLLLVINHSGELYDQGHQMECMCSFVLYCSIIVPRSPGEEQRSWNIFQDTVRSKQVLLIYSFNLDHRLF